MCATRNNITHTQSHRSYSHGLWLGIQFRSTVPFSRTPTSERDFVASRSHSHRTILLAQLTHQHQHRDTHPAVCTVVRGTLTHSFESTPTTCCQKRKVFRGRAFEIKRAQVLQQPAAVESFLPAHSACPWDAEATLVDARGRESCNRNPGSQCQWWRASFSCVRATCYGGRLKGHPHYRVHKLWSLVVLHQQPNGDKAQSLAISPSCCCSPNHHHQRHTIVVLQVDSSPVTHSFQCATVGPDHRNTVVHEKNL